MKTIAKVASFSAAMLCLALPMNAQTSQTASAEEIKALREQITLLQQRLDAVEARAAAPAVAAPAAAPKPDAVTTTLGKKSMISFTTEDKKYNFQVKARLQVDAHTYGETATGNSDIYIRRALVTFKGKADKLSWVMTPNLAGSSVTIDDAWLEYDISDMIHPWLGRIPTLEGWEMAQSNGKTLFIERGLPSSLTTGREHGLMVTGNTENKVFSYGVAVVDGALDGNVQLNNKNLSNDMNLVGKITVSPFAGDKESPLASMTFGLSGSYGQEYASLDSTTDKTLIFKTAGRNTFLEIAKDTVITETINGETVKTTYKVTLDGNRSRFNPQFSYYVGSFGVMSEYMASSYEMKAIKQDKTYDSRDITNSAWVVQASYVLTGEKASAGGVKPNSPFSLDNGTWGAWELGARYNEFKADKDLFNGTSFVNTNNYCQEAKSFGVAVKWYMTENLLWMFSFDNTKFDGLGADKDDEQCFATRVQVEF